MSDDLLLALCADPASDDLRLAYADSLDRRGEHDRARFIRLSLLAAKDRTWRDENWLRDVRQQLIPHWQLREVTSLFTRARDLALLAAHRTGGRAAARALLYEQEDLPASYSAEWSRGFVHSLDLSVLDYLRHHEVLHARLPLERLRLSCDGLAGRSVLARVLNEHAATLRYGVHFSGNANLRNRLANELIEAGCTLLLWGPSA